MSKAIRMVPALALATAACAQTPPPATGDPVATCNADKAQWYVGKQVAERASNNAMFDAGAKTVRRLLPDTVVTMEYQADRLNIVTDKWGTVTAVRCG